MIKHIIFKRLFLVVLVCLMPTRFWAQTERAISGVGPTKAQISNPVVKTLKSQSLLQGQSGSFIPAWDTLRLFQVPGEAGAKTRGLWFEGATMDPLSGNIPFYTLQVPVESNTEIRISNIQPQRTETQFSTDYKHVPALLGKDYASEWYPEQAVMLDQIVRIKGRSWQIIKIYPVQVSKDGRTIRKHAQVDYSFQVQSIPPSTNLKKSAKPLSSASVLSTGDWYKISVVQDGVHRLDGQYLAGLGINLSSLNPAHLRIFGQVPGLLPQNTSVFRYDDLVEIPVIVSGESDGVFNTEDYLAFYAHGPHTWVWDTTRNQYEHQYHYMSDTAYYFLNIQQASGKRIQNASMPAPTYTPGSVRAMAFYEQDKVNFIQSGRNWVGESFDLSSVQTFRMPVSMAHPDSLIRVTIQVAARAAVPTAFGVSCNGLSVGSIPVSSTVLENTTGNYANIVRQTFWVSPALVVNGELPVTLGYNRPSSTQGTNGWLDFIEIEYARLPFISGLQHPFSLPKSQISSQIADISFGGMNSEYLCWDITDISDIRNLPYTLNGSMAVMSTPADQNRDFVVFRNYAPLLLTPVGGVKIPNQNLHGLPQVSYLLVTAPALLPQANQLADFHTQILGHTVATVTTEQIYHEFSAGKQDVTAIRDFVRMFYLRAGSDTTQMPSWLCLFGDGSYDYRNRTGVTGLSLVPPYESRNAVSYSNSFVSDDYFGFLDDGEGNWGEGTNGILIDAYENHGLDIGIGRLPAKNQAEAQVLVNKIRSYASGNSGFGSWKNRLVMVADHKSDEGSLHVSQADSYSGLVQAENPGLNLDKIYLDYYKGINSAEGFLKFPEAKDALIRSLDQGSLIVNYTGHGGEIGWSNSRILEIPDINALNNGPRLPLYVTATCEFGRFDNPELTSGAELLFLKDNGGSIGMFTTVRLVYSGPNQALNQNFYRHVFRKHPQDQTYFSLGEVYRLTKNDTWSSGLNTRSFALLGDPGIVLAFPQNNAAITRVNASVVSSVPDTLRALSLVTLEGEVKYPNGSRISDFNGNLNITVFDKPARYNTILSPFSFFWQRNRIFNGSVSVKDGVFTAQFKVPLDISYEDGFGKVSLYYENGVSDGSGYYDNIIVGGTDTTAVQDKTGPQLDLYMNDEKWADGGMVNQNPLLLARVFDESGINTLGTGIGHEITAVLNRDDSKRIVLNDYYAAKKDSYQEGNISYQYKDLPEGNYDLEMKVWDVANNSSMARTSFVVANNSKVALFHVLNYPNPFTNSTRFFFEHNQRGEMLQAQVKIFTVSGRLVKSLEHTFYGEASLNNDIQWDGLDDYGDRIGRGVYVYEVRLKVLRTGESVGKYEKLVLLR